MGDAVATAVDELNILLAAEYMSLAPRLREISPFIPLDAADDQRVVKQLVEDAQDHEHNLANLIIRLRGAPVAPRFSTRNTNAHYVNLEYLMPALIENLRELVAAYERVGSTGVAVADQLIGRHLEDYQRHLAALEKMHANLLARLEKPNR